MSLLTFNFNKSLIYVLIYWILDISTRLTMFYKMEYFQLSKDNPAENEFLFIIYPVISKLFSGFLIVYINCVANRKHGKNNKNKVKLIYKNPIFNKTKHYYFKLLFITSLEILSTSFYFIFFILIDANEREVSAKISKDIITLLDIIFRYIYSIFLLKIKIFKHHIFSIVSILIGFFLIVPFDICDIIFVDELNTVFTLIYIAVLSIKAIVYPLEDTFIKKFFMEFYVLPEYLLFSVAVTEVIILSIFTPILYFTNVLQFNLVFSYEVVITLTIYILTLAIREYILIKIIYLYSSQFIAFLIISQPIAGSIKDIIEFIKTKDKSEISIYSYISFPLEIIALILIIFGTLIYEEIVIVNKYGLNLNVKRGIIERSEEEMKTVLFEVKETFEELDEIDNNDEDVSIIL